MLLLKFWYPLMNSIFLIEKIYFLNLKCFLNGPFERLESSPEVLHPVLEYLGGLGDGLLIGGLAVVSVEEGGLVPSGDLVLLEAGAHPVQHLLRRLRGRRRLGVGLVSGHSASTGPRATPHLLT